MLNEKQFILKIIKQRKEEGLPQSQLADKKNKKITVGKKDSISHEEEKFIPKLNCLSLCSQTLISNFLYKKNLEKVKNPKSSKLSHYLMGLVCQFIGYESMMTKLRYLSKDWIVFTQEYSHYLPESFRKATLKV